MRYEAGQYVLMAVLFFGMPLAADPIGYTPVGGEAFGMGGAYSADYEDSTALLLNPAGAVEPWIKRKKNKKKRKYKGSVSTGFNGRLARRASPDFLKLYNPRTHTFAFKRYSVGLMSSGTTARLQIKKYKVPFGVGLYLRKNNFSDIWFENFINGAGRVAVSKDSGIYEGGLSGAVILGGRWAVGISLKFLYGYSSVERYLEYTSGVGSGITNFQYFRNIWGLGAAIGTRVRVAKHVTMGLTIDLPDFSIFEKTQYRTACVYRGSKVATDYRDDYSNTGKRFSGPLFRLGIRWKPSYRWKLAAQFTLNPWPARWENDFSDAHLLSAAMGVSFIAAPRHKLAMGLTARVLSSALIRFPADTRTWAAAWSLFYRYSSHPVHLPWIGNSIIRLAIGLRYTYTGGRIGGIAAHCGEGTSQVALRSAKLRAQALDLLLRITMVY